MRSYFHSDNEEIYDRQDARNYKNRAKTAMTKRMIKQTAGWTERYNKWREDQRKLDAYRNGEWKPKPRGFEPHWGKISYTVALQMLNGLVAAGCIIGGAWFIALLTVPGLLALNLYFLIQDSGEYE